MRTVRPRRHDVRGAAGVLLAVTALVALSACGNSDDPEGDATSPTTAATPSSTSGTTTTDSPSEEPSETASETEAPRPAKVKITVEGGVATGAPERLPVTIGQTVRITITSDVAEELHVHGIEQSLDLPAGEKQTLEFVVPADPGPGLYDVELETSALLLFQLEVS